MGVKDNISAVRGDLSGHAQNFFIFFFKKFPQHQAQFPDYKGKNPDSLRNVAKFANHTAKVLGAILEVVEGGNHAADAKRVAKMPQHSKLGVGEFKDLFSTLIGYLQENLGSVDRGAWERELGDIAGSLAGEL